MFDSIGFGEILFIVVIALVVVGPRDLVRVSGKLGRMLGELKRQLQTAQTAVQKEVDQAMETEALQRIAADNRRIMIETGVLDATGRPAAPAPSAATAPAPESAPRDGNGKAGETPLSEPARMSFFDHLNELRNRLVWSLIGAGIAIGAVYSRIEAVTDFLLSPYLHYITDPAAAKPTVLSLGEGLAFDMKVSVWAGLVLAAPWIAVQLWLFLRPALKPAEIRLGVPAFLFLGLLFIAGVAFAFRFMLPPMFKFFIDYNQGRFTPVITISNLWQMESRFLLWTGLIFEMPVAAFVFAFLGLTGPGALARFWRYAIVIAAITSAVITPTADPVNMAVMMTPIIGLYGVSILTAGLGALISRRRRPA